MVERGYYLEQAWERLLGTEIRAMRAMHMSGIIGRLGPTWTFRRA
jgi:hypothetical protein